MKRRPHLCFKRDQTCLAMGSGCESDEKNESSGERHVEAVAAEI